MKKNTTLLISGICLIVLLTAVNTPAQLVTPQQNGALFYFQVADMYFEVDTGFGGRISSLKLGDKEIMFVNREYDDGILWGSTAWPSPQNDWGWPPSEVLDSDPYSVGISGDSIILTSGVDGASDLRFRKTFFASTEDTSVTIIYTFINEGSATVNYAAWEVTRVPAGGISFFPSGEGSVTSGLASYTEKANDVTWYGYENSDAGNNKFFSDGSYGWFAHANDSSILFIKKFQDVPYGSAAPGENEIELWLNGDHAYIELENQSQYFSIAPGDSLAYEVKWFVREIPEGIDISVGSIDLINLVSGITGSGPSQATGTDGYKNEDSDIFALVNPATGYTALVNLPEGTHEIKIMDLTGKIIRTEMVTAYSNIIYTGDLNEGIYIYLLSDRFVFNSGKLIIE
jgi:hypothetical protein